MARLQAREEERSVVVEYNSFVELESKRKSSAWNEASLREQGREYWEMQRNRAGISCCFCLCVCQSVFVSWDLEK